MWFLILLFLNSSASAQSPASFPYRESEAVFIDLTQASYDITYDVQRQKASATAVLRFQTARSGYPVFDSVEDPQQLLLDGSSVSQTLIPTPNRETRVRVVNQIISAGEHTLEIMLPIKQNVLFSKAGVESGFWDTDLTDRSYLEKYLPANLIHDQVPMTFQVHFIGAPAQSIYTNGDVTAIDAENYVIRYPETFTANSIFFHTVPSSMVEEIRFEYASIDGRSVPGVIYQRRDAPSTSSLLQLKNNLVSDLDSLEKNFGPYLHASIIGYRIEKGGMEYNGGFTFSESALNHELSHGYFGRGLIPADGNAGWIDEALAVWWTNRMPARDTPPKKSAMANQPSYTRITDRNAYTIGSDFMAYLNYILQPKGGLKPFLVDYLITHRFTPYTTLEFADAMSRYYQMDLTSVFNTYVFGRP